MTFRLLPAEQGSRPSEFQGTETSLSVPIPNECDIRINITRETLLGCTHVRDSRKLVH